MDYSYDVIHPAVIKVDMAVSRCQTFGKQPLAQVWGHVGDYEVSIWLPIEDVRVRRLVHLAGQDQDRRRRRTHGT